MKNRVKVTIAALAVGALAMCGNMTGYATESADAVSTQAGEDVNTDTESSEQNTYKVTYELNGGTKDGKDIYKKSYTSESWNVDLSAIKPTKSGYRLTGWWYTNTNDTEQKIDTTNIINLEKYFPNTREVTLTAEWTQVVTVTVDGNLKPDEVAAGNKISVNTAPSNTLNLDKWVVNASDANNGWELKPNNNEGMIEVKPAAAEKHVINIDDSTGFGITKDNAKANFVSYWSPQSGKYLVQVKNETGHPLKFSGKTLNDKATSDPEFFGIITELPKKTDNGYFTISDSSIEERVANQNGEYVTYGENNVKAYNLTLSANDVERNIKISFESQTGVTYTNESTFVETLKNGATLSPQDLLDTANNTATRDGFTNYRWTYSVKDINGESTEAENISSNAWVDGSSENILKRTFNYSFPYYEFEFEPVWQGDVNFKLEVPEGEEESVSTPKPIEGIDVGTTIKLPKAPEIEGYTFNGWKSDVSADTVYKPGSSYEVTSANVTFTGSWTVNKYKITWNQGDNESKFDPREVEYKSSVELPIPEKTGYTFTGWKSDVEGDDTLYNEEKPFTMPSHNVTMTAQWQINTYTVTYNGNGGTIGIYTGTDTVKYNDSYKIKNVSGITPTRYGYEFLGWRKNNEGSLLQAGDSFTMPANDVELVAQWERKSPNLGNKGKHDLSNGVGYTYNGTFRIKGDPSNYQDKITFYVPKAGEYTFE